MNRIITIGREFGSGGRELGRRLAEELGIEYYDREIMEQIAQKTSFSRDYVQQVVEGRSHRLYPITINHTFNTFAAEQHAQMIQTVFEAQIQTLHEMAELSSCVIVGRCADYFLREYQPFRIFVYADLESRVQRCLERSDDDEVLEGKELRKQIRRIDRNRARYYTDCTGQTWGDKQFYDLCLNTTGKNIKQLVPSLARMLE